MMKLIAVAHTCNLEWMEGANMSRRGEEYVEEPPTPDELEKEMRKDKDVYIQFVIRMVAPVYGKEMWNEVAGKTNLSAFVTTSQEAFALLLYKNGYEAWAWMNSDSSSSSDGVGTEKSPPFKYTSRSETHIRARSSGWTMEGLNAFNKLYARVVEDRRQNGKVFDEALLKYYDEKKSKKRRKPNDEIGEKRRQLELSDDLAGLREEELASEDEGEDSDVVGV